MNVGAPAVHRTDRVLDLTGQLALTTRVTNEHLNDGDICAVCGSAFPCERAALVEHDRPAR